MRQLWWDTYLGLLCLSTRSILTIAVDSITIQWFGTSHVLEATFSLLRFLMQHVDFLNDYTVAFSCDLRAPIPPCICISFRPSLHR
jgi:hypothetical protein